MSKVTVNHAEPAVFLQLQMYFQKNIHKYIYCGGRSTYLNNDFLLLFNLHRVIYYKYLNFGWNLDIIFTLSTVVTQYFKLNVQLMSFSCQIERNWNRKISINNFYSWTQFWWIHKYNLGNNDIPRNIIHTLYQFHINNSVNHIFSPTNIYPHNSNRNNISKWHDRFDNYN